jgi:hypothetical protein
LALVHLIQTFGESARRILGRPHFLYQGL